MSTALAAAPGRILLVGPLPPPSGGMANQTRQLARLLAADGVAVELVQTNAPIRPAWIRNVRGIRALFRLVPYLRALWRGTGRADVVHVMANSGWSWHLFAAPAVWIAALRGVPAVVNYRGGEAGPFLARQHALVQPTLARAALLVVPSGFLAGVFAGYGHAVREVPNIVDLDAFAPAPALPGSLHLVVTRNLEPIYDNATAIRAFADVAAVHPDARLTVTGEGPERDRLLALCENLRIADRVRFTGRLDNRELPALYRSASVVVNPSTVDNLPVSLLEALASGVPVVSTNVGGVSFVVADGATALLVPPRDPRAMADAILRVAEYPALAGALRNAGLAAARRYSWSAVRPILYAAYQEAIAGASAHRTPSREAT
jgi:L-malate glycosyltransferase